ncbi:MAG: AraC family transcriptional regulator [Clostridia bacterium]|nr:AraC family transcriptional regulator [Clostridia bacterium]
MNILRNDLLLKELNRLNMNIGAADYAILDIKWKHQNARSNYTRIYYIRSGEGTIYCNGKKITLSPGNIYIIPAELDLSYECNSHLEKLYFHINILRYSGYDIFSQIKECIIFENRSEQIERLYQCWNSSDLLSAIEIKATLFADITAALHKTGLDNSEVDYYSKPVKAAMKYINENLSGTLTVKEISSQLFLSESFIQKAFKNEVGVPIGKYINDRLMHIAETKLRNTNLSIKELSDSLGFCDQFYFSRVFSKFFGLSPLKYRKFQL